MDLRECLVRAQIAEALADAADSEAERQKWEAMAAMYRRRVRTWMQHHRASRLVNAA